MNRSTRIRGAALAAVALLVAGTATTAAADKSGDSTAATSAKAAAPMFTRVEAPDVLDVRGGQRGEVIVQCPSGMQAVSGGHWQSLGDKFTVLFSASVPLGGNTGGWSVQINNWGTQNVYLMAEALCVDSSQIG
ncbi:MULTISPECIES: hypothetical protein [Streptomyces]|uniref:Ig-like domain-containing protein n=1 Tax=Streptomyces uncialis TaxID=1048205 RepID=A0A1Q4VDS0_9ACTN|nr:MULTISPECIES: hypothetical protein [Streptomyces]OKH95870.1 hypothetical protein AB852_03775 [Streptomyces uncialis]